MVPLRVRAVGRLHEAHARLREAPCEEAAESEVPGHRVVEPVEPPGRLGLALDAHQLGRLGLHAEGELEGLDAALERLVRAGLLELAPLPALQEIELASLHRRRHRLVVEEVDGRLLGLHPGRADCGAVVGSGQEGRRVVLHAAVLVRGADGDEPGQVLVPGAQSVGDPRAHRGAHEAVAAGVHRQDRAAVGALVPHIERMKHSSSTTEAMLGRSSLTQAPDWPCCLNSRGS